MLSRRELLAAATAVPVLSLPAQETIAWSAEAVGGEIKISGVIPGISRGVAAFIERGWTLRGTVSMLRYSLLHPNI